MWPRKESASSPSASTSQRGSACPSLAKAADTAPYAPGSATTSAAPTAATAATTSAPFRRSTDARRARRSESKRWSWVAACAAMGQKVRAPWTPFPYGDHASAGTAFRTTRGCGSVRDRTVPLRRAGVPEDLDPARATRPLHEGDGVVAAAGRGGKPELGGGRAGVAAGDPNRLREPPAVVVAGHDRAGALPRDRAPTALVQRDHRGGAAPGLERGR